MTFKKLSSIAVSATMAIAAGNVALASPADVCPAPLKMADTGIEGMGNLTEAFAPFAESFEMLTGVPLELYALSNRTAAGTALQFDEVDLVFAGPSEFVLFQQLAEMDVLFSLIRPHYGSSFVVRADSDIQTLADLADRRVALKDVGSTSGHIFPMMLLAEAGLNPDNMDIVMAGDARIQVLINGDVEAMGGGNKDWDAVREQDPNTEYRLLAQTDTLPGDPVVMRGTLPEACRIALRETLAANVEEVWDSLTSTERNADKFIKRDAFLSFDTDPAIYDVVRRAYEVAGISLDD